MSDISIHTGFWTNWSEGNLRRSTLTVSSSTGGFLIAFLALFVTLAMSQLWEIVCYCLHFWRSTPEERSAFHHQNQALLRSGSPAFSFAQKMMRILWAWKGVRGRGYKVGFGMVAFAVAFGTCTIVASLFSSQVTNTDSVVLVLPTHCGWPPHNHDEDNLIEALSLYIPGIKIFENSRAYAQKCYGLTAGPNGASCNFFVKPALERTIKRDIDCPFSPGICESKGITLTSGYIDSHEDLGINAAPEDRIRFRKSLSCAVLKAESNYSSEWLIQPAELQNISSPLYQSPGVAFKLYFLGSQIIQGVPAPYSFYFSNISSPRSGYQTQVFAASTSEPVDGYSFEPILELRKDDSLVFLWVLENKVVYTEPVNDPWFKATTRDLNRNTAVWKADKAAGVIGCVETYEFCNKTSCLKPLSIPVREEYFPGLETLNLNEKQKATFWYLRKAALYGRAYLPPMLLQDELLRAREQVFQDPIYGGSGISVALPDNQWEIEVDNLFNTSLSFLQHMSVEHVSQSNIRITPNATLRDFIQKENYTGAEIVCNSQMIRSTSYSSLKVIGLGCILGIGSFFMVLSLLLPIIMPLVYKWYKARLCRQEVEWQGNDLFQLLLRAFEGCGVFERTLSGKALVPPEPNKEFKLPWVEEIEQSARSREGVTRRNTFGGDTAIDEQRGEIASIETHESSESTAVVHTLPQQSEEITLQTPTGPRSTHNP